MTIHIRAALAVLFALACLGLTAPPANARTHHHHSHHQRHHSHHTAGARHHGGRHSHGHKRAGEEKSPPPESGRHHSRRHRHSVSVKGGKATVDQPQKRHAALCQSVMVHRKWVTHCRGE